LIVGIVSEEYAMTEDGDEDITEEISVDFRFMEIADDLGMLSFYLEMLSSGLPGLVDTEKKRLKEEIDGKEDDFGVASAMMSHFEDRLDAGITTRFVGASVVIAAWALYESAVISIAEEIRERRGFNLKLDHLRGS
jgi:hypothetical protein